MLAADVAARLFFDGIMVPVCIMDASGHLAAMNPRAEALWRTSSAALAGKPALVALGIRLTGGADTAPVAPRMPCEVTLPDGQTRSASLIWVPLGEGHTGIIVLEEATLAVLDATPGWALADPGTGLASRQRWERELPAWDERAGAVLLLDLDNLKEVNDLYGHAAGDRALAAVGTVAARLLPADAIGVRWGGDEFLFVLPAATAQEADGLADRIAAGAAEQAEAADVPMAPRLSWGVCTYRPGELSRAIQQADEELYARKGILLRSARGGRLILTREGRSGLREPGEDRVQAPIGQHARAFGPEFDAFFRAQYARACDQAREFVDFAAPEPGTAVVEVGAGTGRVTFDGGLAERVGPDGQLLVSDPSGTQLQAARRRAADLGMRWLRFVRAPAERLPLVSGTADMVIGAMFLHFTQPGRALREMARVVRPGGRVALSVALPFEWPPAWLEALEPVRRALERHGLPFRSWLMDEDTVIQHVMAAGLLPVRAGTFGPERWDAPSAPALLAVWRQADLIRLLLGPVPEAEQAAVREAFEARVVAGFRDASPTDWTVQGMFLNLVARRK